MEESKIIKIHTKDAEDAFSGRKDVFEKWKDWEVKETEEEHNKMIETAMESLEERGRLNMEEYIIMLKEQAEMEKNIGDLNSLLGKDTGDRGKYNNDFDGEAAIMRGLSDGRGDEFGY